MKVYLNGTSNAPLRVRIALALKEIEVEEVHIDLERDGGGQHSAAFHRLNPQEMIPVLVDGDVVIRQSLAIIDYLEERKPIPSLLPGDAAGRARVRALALAIACDAQPVLNLRVRQYLRTGLGATETQCAEWMRHWLHLSLNEYEALLRCDSRSGIFSHGDTPTLADVCLVPHVLMARRFGADLTGVPAIARIFDAAMREPRILEAVEMSRVPASMRVTAGR